MATRSTIALQFADGTVEQVYAHWDGYLDGNGATLRDHYSDPFKLRDLLDLGDISSLNVEIGTAHPFGYFGTDITQEEYEAKYGNMTTFYGRDRGEKGTNARKFKDFEDYKENGQQEEYDYILTQQGWLVRCYVTDGKWVPLAEAYTIQENYKEVA